MKGEVQENTYSGFLFSVFFWFIHVCSQKIYEKIAHPPSTRQCLSNSMELRTFFAGTSGAPFVGNLTFRVNFMAI